MKKILIFAGTRPEAIKMFPVYTALKSKAKWQSLLVAAGQHKEMLSQALADFAVTPDITLDVMSPGQTLALLSAKLFTAVDDLLERERPDAILVQGDTTTVQVASLCAFYRRVPVGHVEAGLRSGDLYAPFPEELNRRVASITATWHFAPTQLAADNLLAEKVAANSILVTGNTVIDSLFHMRKHVRDNPPQLPAEVAQIVHNGESFILVTGHRRENFGEGFQNICRALLDLVEAFPDLHCIYPVHLNPYVQKTVKAALADHPRIILTTPLSYKPFVYLMDKCRLILSDSGGVQEEAPSLGKPVLVLRDVTERPEGVRAGVNILVGTDRKRITQTASRLLSDSSAYQAIAATVNPYGDGHAGERIADFLGKYCGKVPV